MKRFSDFSDILADLESSAERYDHPHPNGQTARLFLVALTNFEDVKSRIEFQQKYAENIQDRHKFQFALVHQSVNTLYNIFSLVRYHHYSGIYREIRYLFESFWIIRGVNRDLETAAIKWRHFRVQAKSINESGYDEPGFDYDYIDYLGSRRDSEQDKLYSTDPSYRDVFNYLNERAAHPLRTEGSRLDRTYNQGEEWQAFWLASSLMVVILGEFELTLADAGVQRDFADEIELIREQLKTAIGESAPTFVNEYL